ncbi:hypothetical protein EZV62_018923 [Acer yangbiense]|uniref:DUF1985 domain-containing protein n=1 Tax=Acer yangbiense TaxID=1000413 RepID=A0A5C7H9T0_9ROSI|nr:hypothetical protein EZV62_018923 [Acer yangbiense]
MMAPKFVFDKANFSRKKIVYFSSLKDTIKNINNKLTMEQKIMFEQTCFGNFLSIGGNRLLFSAQMVHQLLLRQVENPNTNEIWFLVGEKTIRFSMQEFCVVTGLDCSPYPSVDVLTKVKGVRLRDEVFFGNMDLHINDLEAAFVKANIDDDKTIVKLALLYFLDTVLSATGKNSPLDNALREKKPTVYNLVGFPFAFQLRVDTFLELTQEEKQQNCLLHFISPSSCEVPQTNIQEDKPQDDRADTATATQSKRLINESYHEMVTVANNGKSPVEAALEPSWPSSQFYGHNSNFHADLKTEIPSRTLIDQHVSVSFPDKGNDGSPSSSLDDEDAFFTELNSILDKSPNELLDSSSQIILDTSQDINQAKHFLRHCLSTDFESFLDSSQRDKVNSSLELLIKVGNFPPSMLNMIMGDIRLATNEMKELTKKMEELTKMFAEKEKYKMDLEVDQVLAFYYHLKICSASLKLPEVLGPETFSDPTGNSQVSEPFAYKILQLKFTQKFLLHQLRENL